MQNTEMIGINELKLDQLVLDINTSALKIKNKLDTISDLVNSSEQFFDCASGDLFRDKFNGVSSSFSTVNKNIMNISEDLLKVKARLYNVETDVKNAFVEASQDMKLSNSLIFKEDK